MNKTPLCKFDSETMRCSRCGYQAKDLPTYRACRTVEEMAQAIVEDATKRRIKVPPIRIGDAAAKVLSAVGITEERFKKATGKKDCGCGRRKSALNAIGASISAAVEKGSNAVLNAVLPADATPDEFAALAQAIAASPATNQGLREKAAGKSA